MERKEQLELCNICRNKAFDPKKGIICGVTRQYADFDKSCTYFVSEKKEEIKQTQFIQNLGNYKPNKKIAKYLKIVISFIIILTITVIIGRAYRVFRLYEISETTKMVGNSFDLLELFEGFWALIYIPTYILSIILFAIWNYRVYYNVGLSYKTYYSKGWAVGAWFVPILNVYRPYKIINEIKELYQKYPLKESKNHLEYLKFWWGLWIFNEVINRMIGEMETISIENQIHYYLALIIGATAIFIPLSVITILIIKELTENEENFFITKIGKY